MQTIEWTKGNLRILDQTQLPEREALVDIGTVEEMAEAIKSLRVRGAPLIGVSAAYGLALAARAHENERAFLARMKADAQLLRDTRPTAVNLFWAIDACMEEIAQAYQLGGGHVAAEAALQFAERLKAQDVEVNRALGANGASLLKDGDSVLTHCNAGALATAGFGTALGVIRAAVAAGKNIHVYADETRPLLQGARLTCWELMRDGIPVTLIADNMAASLMLRGKIQKVIVGADRIARNGDTANKIGTYGAAVLAGAHGVPFYVAAPESTIDRTLERGEMIPIEFRDPAELRAFQGVPSAPAAADAWNPAFDVTPARLIAGIISEKKVYLPDAWGNFALAADA